MDEATQNANLFQTDYGDKNHQLQVTFAPIIFRESEYLYTIIIVLLSLNNVKQFS